MSGTRVINIGDKFSRLEVISLSGKRDKSRQYYYYCKCDCGNFVDVRKDSLLNGRVKSCGCYTLDRLTKHNKCNTRLYHIRSGMIERCCNPRNKDYKNYGARGIDICQEWKLDFSKFYAWAITNGYSDGLSIDRIDNNKGYCPENCRWVSNKVQGNNRRTNKYITYNGETKTVSQWADVLGIGLSTLRYRLFISNMPLEKAFNVDKLKNK
jgi:hypothetical protein